MGEKSFRTCVVLLLFVIAVCETYTIYKDVMFRPTVGSLRDAAAWERHRIIDNLPVSNVHVIGGMMEVKISQEP